MLERLNSHFEIFIFYYNPNISSLEEYAKRGDELKRLISEMPVDIAGLIIEPYDAAPFDGISRGLESAQEGVAEILRLKKAAEKAEELACDYFTTTLTISPLKSAEKINAIGDRLATAVAWLPSDFKKKEGYKRSVELSKQYNLYRQNFCGCVFSKGKSDDRV